MPPKSVERIDPIVVAESRLRMEENQRRMMSGIQASDALLWFKEYTGRSELSEPDGILTIQAKLVASGTPNASVAQRYIDRAARNYAADIIDDAIRLAQNEFDEAVALRSLRKDPRA